MTLGTAYGVTGATVRFGDIVALDDVTVRIRPGGVVAVVGGDGAGKTTLLRTLVGQVPLSAGTIAVPGRGGIGYMPATAGSWLELTVQENIDFVGGIYGLKGDELRERGAALLRQADLTRATDRLSGQLSGGMRRKLGFSLAAVPDPPLLVLDEPSTGVDPVSRVDLWRLISRAAAGGAAVILTTSYLDEAERAEHLVALDRGRVVLQGAPDEVASRFTGTITAAQDAVRRNWAWRRGSSFHEYWPAGVGEAAGQAITPNLEDIVMAASLLARAGSPS